LSGIGVMEGAEFNNDLQPLVWGHRGIFPRVGLIGVERSARDLKHRLGLAATGLV